MVNLAETCEQDNPVQLITAVQAAPNHMDDSVLLSQALPDLKARTGVEVLYTDGGYGGGQADEALQAHDVTLLQTAIRERSPSHGHLRLSDFAFEGEQIAAGMSVTCPNGQTAGVNLSQRGKAYQRISAWKCMQPVHGWEKSFTKRSRGKRFFFCPRRITNFWSLWAILSRCFQLVKFGFCKEVALLQAWHWAVISPHPNPSPIGRGAGGSPAKRGEGSPAGKGDSAESKAHHGNKAQRSQKLNSG